MGDTESEPESGGSTKLFDIREPDLAELEHLLPELVSALYPVFASAPKDRYNKLRTQIRRMQKIIVDVRWNYGPPNEVQIIPADG